MDLSVSIPPQLVLRSLPVNLEIMELLVDSEFLDEKSSEISYSEKHRESLRLTQKIS